MAYDYSVVDASVNSTTVHDGPAILYGLYVNTALSANDLPIKDGSATVVTLAASAGVGTHLDFGEGIRVGSSLVVDPDDAATGSVTVFYSKG